MYMRCLYVLHNVCGKVLIMCGKVCDLMCLGVVILACILSPLRENVNHPTDKISETELRDFISLAYKYAWRG